MALINCPKCGKPISEQAVNCPYCGSSVSKTEASMSVIGFYWKWLIVLALVCILWGLYAADYCAFHIFTSDYFSSAKGLWNATNFSLIATCSFAILLILLKPWRTALKIIFFVGLTASVSLILANPIIKHLEIKNKLSDSEILFGKTIPFEYNGTEYEVKVSKDKYTYYAYEIDVECEITTDADDPELECGPRKIWFDSDKRCFVVPLIVDPNRNQENNIYLFIDPNLQGYEIGNWDGTTKIGPKDGRIDSYPDETSATDDTSLSEEEAMLAEIEQIGYGLSKEVAVPNHDIEFCTQNDEANLKKMFVLASSKCDFPKNEETYAAFKRGFLKAYNE